MLAHTAGILHKPIPMLISGSAIEQLYISWKQFQKQDVKHSPWCCWCCRLAGTLRVAESCAAFRPKARSWLHKKTVYTQIQTEAGQLSQNGLTLQRQEFSIPAAVHASNGGFSLGNGSARLDNAKLWCTKDAWISKFTHPWYVIIWHYLSHPSYTGVRGKSLLIVTLLIHNAFSKYFPNYWLTYFLAITWKISCIITVYLLANTGAGTWQTWTFSSSPRSSSDCVDGTPSSTAFIIHCSIPSAYHVSSPCHPLTSSYNTACLANTTSTEDCDPEQATFICPTCLQRLVFSGFVGANGRPG